MLYTKWVVAGYTCARIVLIYSCVAQSIAIMNRLNDFRKTHLIFDYYFKFSLTQKITSIIYWSGKGVNIMATLIILYSCHRASCVIYLYICPNLSIENMH